MPLGLTGILKFIKSELAEFEFPRRNWATQNSHTKPMHQHIGIPIRVLGWFILNSSTDPLRLSVRGYHVGTLEEALWSCSSGLLHSSFHFQNSPRIWGKFPAIQEWSCFVTFTCPPCSLPMFIITPPFWKIPRLRTFKSEIKSGCKSDPTFLVVLWVAGNKYGNSPFTNKGTSHYHLSETFEFPKISSSTDQRVARF